MAYAATCREYNTLLNDTYMAPAPQGKHWAVQAAAMAVLGMAGWGVVFMAAPAATSLFVNTASTQVMSRPTVASMPAAYAPNTILRANKFNGPQFEERVAPVETNMMLPERASAVGTVAAANVLLWLSPIVLAVAGVWAAFNKRSNTPTLAYAGAEPMQFASGNSWNIDMNMSPTVMRATIADNDLDTANVPTIAEPIKRAPEVDAWDPEPPVPEGKDYHAIAKLHTLAVGVTVANTPVEIREKLAVAKEDWPIAIDELVKYDGVQEAAVLSTCNRMEIYAMAPSYEEGIRDIVTWMTAHSGVSFEELQPYLFLKRDKDAVDHILQVSSGLDSLIVGEGQILSQVKSVHAVGSTAKGFGPYLSNMFMQAIQAGKRVRSETTIASGAVSVSSAAAELAQLKLPLHSWDNVNVTLIGAGKMSQLLVKHLLSKGCTKMTVLNRSMPRSIQLQEDFPAAELELKLMDELLPTLKNSDVIFVASSSTEILIHPEDIKDMGARPEHVGGIRRFFDISVPRNTSRELNDLPDAIVYNVDDLKEVVEMNKGARAQAAADALVLLEEERAAFEGWMSALQAVPTIKRLRGKAENIRLLELEKAKAKLSDDMTPKQIKVLEDLSRGIMNKMLHAPMQSLRTQDDLQAHLENISVLGRVFGLSEEDEVTTSKKK